MLEWPVPGRWWRRRLTGRSLGLQWALMLNEMKEQVEGIHQQLNN